MVKVGPARPRFLCGNCWRVNASSLTCDNEVTSLEKATRCSRLFYDWEIFIFSISKGDLSDFCHLQKCWPWPLYIRSNLVFSLCTLARLAVEYDLGKSFTCLFYFEPWQRERNKLPLEVGTGFQASCSGCLWFRSRGFLMSFSSSSFLCWRQCIH